MDCSPSGPSVLAWDFPGKNIEVGCHFLLHLAQMEGNKTQTILGRWLAHLLTSLVREPFPGSAGFAPGSRSVGPLQRGLHCGLIQASDSKSYAGVAPTHT